MIFYLAALAFLIFYKAVFFSYTSFNRNYLSKENTQSIKGIFMLLIFSSHYAQYVRFDGIYDSAFRSFQSFLGQAIVTMFLFYSGYGVFESIKSKPGYVKTIPFKRIYITWLNFSLAILLFFMLNLLLHKSYSLSTTVLAFTGWTSIGNSNWYIFAILCCYLMTWISFRLFSRHHVPALFTITLLSFVYLFLVRHYKGSDTWWYDTIFCYAAGMWYSYFKKKIENLFFQNSDIYFFALILTFFFVLAAKPFRNHIAVYEIWSLGFTALILLLSMKISINNRILSWIGIHTFEIYIIQRLPMITLKHLKLDQYPYLFGVLSLLTCIFLVFFFHKLLSWADNLSFQFFKRKS